MLSFGGRKKDRSRPRFIPDSFVRGAIVWQVQIDAEYSRLDCFLGISGDTLVLVDEKNRDVVFACPCASVLAWSSQTSSLRVFYHQGECIVLRTRDPDVDEIQEIVSRLSCVTKGCETQELTLRRNNLGQLGFHVQQDGLITEVESQGHAFEAGLRQNSRLVEICKIVVATLSYDQMVDLLKTSVAVVVTVVPAASDDSPRRGCSLHNCSYLSLGGGHGSGSGGGDYENIDAEDAGGPACRSGKSSPRQQVALQTAPKGSSHQQYDRSSSPTRSTPSSGYGSRKSVTVNLEHRFRNNEMTSASSQSSEEKWYDLGEMTDTELRGRSGGGGRGGQALPLTTGSGGHRQQQHYGHHQRHHHHGNSQPDRGESSSSSPPPPPLPARSSSSATAFHQASLSTSGSYGSGQVGSSRNRRGGGGDFQQQQSPSPPSTLSPSAAPQHHGGGRSAARDYSSCSGSNYAHLVPLSSSHHGSAEEGLDDCASGLGGGGASPAAGPSSGNYCRVGGGPLSASVSSYAIGSATSDQLVHERLHRLRASASGAANDDRMHPSAVAHHLAIVKPCATASSSLSSSSSFGVSVESGGSLDRCNGSRSEDELSGSSGNSLSPRTSKRRPLPPCGSGHPPPPSNGEMTSGGVHHGRSGMQNPRAGSRTVPSSSHSGDEAKMMTSRPTAGPSSYRPYVNGSSSLGAGPAAESTFQEDLLKLINPDLIASENSSQGGGFGGPASSSDCFVRPRTPPPIPSRTNSLDRISKEIQQQQHRKHHHHHQLSAPSSRGGSSADKDSPPSMVSSDVILTTARPATVISTNSSPAPGDHHRAAALAAAAAAAARDERLSPRATVGVQGTLASKSLSSLPTTPTICPLQDDEDGDDLDWPSLAESTSKAMEEVPGVSAASSVTTTTFNSLIPWIDDVSDRLGLDPLRASTRSPLLVGHGSHRIRELESKIRVLEEDLVKEKNRKAALELEVKRLRDENSRLQEESHTAAAQLRRFTEWFFQSMDKL